MAKPTRIDIIYEDNHLIAVNKPAGVLVHSDSTGDDTLLEAIKRYVKHKYNKPGDVFMGVIHRIDRPVSGVVVFARTSKALSRMNKAFQDREVEKQYYAIINKVPDQLEGKLEHYLAKDGSKNVARIHQSDRKGAKLAKLSYKYISGLNGFHMLEVNPETGRPHQIRIQLAAMGTPIVGDLKYGYDVPTQDASICLHSRTLNFIHPVKKTQVKLLAEIPRKQYWDFFI